MHILFFKCVNLHQCDVLECLGHVHGTVLSLECILTKQHGVHSGKHPRNAISKTLKFEYIPRCLALKNLCL